MIQCPNKALSLLLFFLWILISPSILHAKTGKPEPPLSQDISEKEIIERLTRIEEGQKNIIKEMNLRFENVDNRFESVEKRFEMMDRRFEMVEKRFASMENQLQRLSQIFLGIVAAFAGIVALTIGFAIWNRRTALRPYLERHQKLEEREEKLEKVLKSYAKTHADLAEILRQQGLM